MVAAAGGEAATLGAGQGIAAMAVVAILLIVLAALGDRASLIARVPLEKSRPVLVDRAADLRTRLGYADPVADTASGLDFSEGYLNWAARHDAGADKWAQLATGRPSAIRFWYRTSPSLMLPYRGDGAIWQSDPPMLTRGMVRVDLDMQGRLLWFEAVPSPTQEATGRPVDWDPLFESAGLDRSRFVEVAPTLLPRAYADDLKTWEGTLAEVPGVTFQVEAASFRGRPTMFALLGPWDLGTGQETSRPSPALRAMGVLIISALPIGAALLARRNLRMGRGDRRGAFRAWAFAFGTLVVSWAISPTHVAGLEEADRMFSAFGRLLFWTGVMYVTYLALEPYVRRTWPNVLIAWSRCVSGRLRDALVGRAIVVGAVGGLCMALVDPAFVLAPPIVGWPQPRLDETTLAPLLGTREHLAALMSEPFNALQDGMIVLLILSLIRQMLRKLAAVVPERVGRVIGSDVTTSLVSLLLFLVIVKRNSIDPVYPWLDASFSLVLLAVLPIVAFRFGLLALMCAFLVDGLVGQIALTLDPSKPYAGAGWLVASLILALSAVGVWLARAGRPMFGPASDAAPVRT